MPAFIEHLLYTRLQAEPWGHRMAQAALTQHQGVHRLQGKQTGALVVKDQSCDGGYLWHRGAAGFWEEVISKM